MLFLSFCRSPRCWKTQRESDSGARSPRRSLSSVWGWAGHVCLLSQHDELTSARKRSFWFSTGGLQRRLRDVQHISLQPEICGSSGKPQRHHSLPEEAREEGRHQRSAQMCHCGWAAGVEYWCQNHILVFQMRYTWITIKWWKALRWRGWGWRTWFSSTLRQPRRYRHARRLRRQPRVARLLHFCPCPCRRCSCLCWRSRAWGRPCGSS